MRFINQITNTYCAQIIQLNKLVILMKMASEKYGEEDVNKTLWDNFSDA